MFLFLSTEQLLVNKTDLLAFVGPIVTRPVQDHLAVLLLGNRLYMRIGTFLVIIQIQKKSSPLPGFESKTDQVGVYEANGIPMCHRAFVAWSYFILFKQVNIYCG